MDISELQNNWSKQYNEPGIQNNLVIKLFKESRQNKVKSKLRKLVFYNSLFIAFNVLVIGFSWSFLANHFPNPGVLIPSLSLILLSGIALFKNIIQLDDISKINFELPIIQLQKIIERLKIRRIKHNRFIFIFSYLYFWLMVCLVLSFDLFSLISIVWQNAPLVIIIHGTFSVLWFPLSLWILKKYDSPDEKSKFWKALKKDSHLTDQSVNFSLNNAQSFLIEIEVFEKA